MRRKEVRRPRSLCHRGKCYKDVETACHHGRIVDFKTNWFFKRNDCRLYIQFLSVTLGRGGSDGSSDRPPPPLFCSFWLKSFYLI